MLVQKKATEDERIIGPRSVGQKLSAMLRPRMDIAPVRLYGAAHRTNPWAVGWFPNRLARRVEALSADVVNLHWVGQGFLPVQELPRLQKPVIWTLHDSGAFTGGCYIPYDCTNYTAMCGQCHHLGSQSARDLSRITWRRKQKHWRSLDFCVVAPSRWLASCAARSSLMADKRIEVIPNGLDLERFRPLDRALARDALSLPQDRKLILISAAASRTDPNKGYALLRAALQHPCCQGLKKTTDLVVLGTSVRDTELDSIFNCHYLGYLHDDVSIVLAYCAADVFVLPSVQENLPNSIMEAMACGTPCVAFAAGGITDLIDAGANGYLAKPYDAAELARGIAAVLQSSIAIPMREQARRKVEVEFDGRMIARRYAEIYRALLDDSRRSAFAGS